MARCRSQTAHSHSLILCSLARPISTSSMRRSCEAPSGDPTPRTRSQSGSIQCAMLFAARTRRYSRNGSEPRTEIYGTHPVHPEIVVQERRSTSIASPLRNHRLSVSSYGSIFFVMLWEWKTLQRPGHDAKSFGFPCGSYQPLLVEAPKRSIQHFRFRKLHFLGQANPLHPRLQSLP